MDSLPDDISDDLIAPHGGGPLRPLMARGDSAAALRAQADTLPRHILTSREYSDLLLLAMGAYTPLEGFMGETDWKGSAQDMKLADGTFWPLPITLSVTEKFASELPAGSRITLAEPGTDASLAILTVRETYRPDPAFECERVFKTMEEAHPGAAKVLAQPPVNLGGRLEVFSEGSFPSRFGELYSRPADIRETFRSLGWRRVAAFNTRNPMHRSHEFLVKQALEGNDGIFIHQVIGELKAGDIPAEVRVRAIDRLVEKYFEPGTALQGGLPIEMRYAGPREALLHAVIRQNFGCSQIIIGRDHAGVGSYYGPTEAQEVFDTLWPGALAIEPLKFGVAFHCYACGRTTLAEDCAHQDDDRLNISGTELRAMLGRGDAVPEEFSRPEVVAILREYYQSLG